MTRKHPDKHLFALLQGTKGFATEGLTFFDGCYMLFLGERGFPYGFRKCSLATSYNLLDWEKKTTVIQPRFLEPSSIHAGAAITRNGKTVYLYRKKSLFRDSIRMLSTTDFLQFDKHPVPVITGKVLPKNMRALSAPRVVKSGDFFYLITASSLRKQGRILFYKSPNLIDWSLRGILSQKDKCDYPALIQMDGKHILLEQRECNGGKVFGYRQGSARLEEGCFTPFSEFKSLGEARDPRITTLPDGRCVLVSTLENINGKSAGLALPKEIICRENEVYLKPVRELYEKRKKENAAAFVAREPVTEIEGIGGKAVELNIFADLSRAKSFRVIAYMTGCRGLFITIRKEKGVAEFDFSTLRKKKKDKCPLVAIPLPTTDKLDMQLFLFGDRFECFLGGGEVSFSRGVDASLTGSGIGFDAEGEVPCEAVAYHFK